MPREFPRHVRIAEQIKRVVAPAIAARARDAGLGMATVTAVEVAPDLSEARIFVSVFGHNDDLTALREARADLRRLVGHELRLKKVPRLTVEHDPTIARAAHIDELLSGRGGDAPER